MYDARSLTLLVSSNHADHRRLVRAATRLLGTADAEDAVQDAYVRALEGEQRELNSAQAWLLTVVRNLAIDRLRRRNWMQQWLETMGAADAEQASPSAEMDAALAQEASHALHVLAAQLAPEDGAALLLHEVFEVGHAEIAEANGQSEAASRQQLRRALLRLRLRQARSSADGSTPTKRDPSQETVFRLYLQSLQLRDPQVLWAMLRHPPISAVAGVFAVGVKAPSTPQTITSGVVQMGGQLGLVLTLDGVRLCVVPLGVRPECEPETALLS
ncbi:MAG: sigma-70 family RNA polymerase sigma factor [Curvibacter sp.]|nr:MAG: sigma-70 family RNA polymerase sigma factor [Curvibacter sp.]